MYNQGGGQYKTGVFLSTKRVVFSYSPKAYRTAVQLKKDTIHKRAKIQPTGIPVEMAFKEAKPPLKFKSFTDIPRNATAASNEGMLGVHKNSWLDPRTKKALQKNDQSAC